MFLIHLKSIEGCHVFSEYRMQILYLASCKLFVVREMPPDTKLFITDTASLPQSTYRAFLYMLYYIFIYLCYIFLKHLVQRVRDLTAKR